MEKVESKSRIIDCMTWCVVRCIQSSLTKDEALLMFKIGWMMMQEICINPNVEDVQRLAANLLNDELEKHPLTDN